LKTIMLDQFFRAQRNWICPSIFTDSLWVRMHAGQSIGPLLRLPPREVPWATQSLMPALTVSIAALLFSMPVGGQMRSFARHGNDVWIAIAVTAGMGFGIAARFHGASALLE
jgi:hypothetical protein